MGTQIGGDFIGFSFGGVHSSSLGIIRTSDGSRYNQNLLPTIQDKTVQVPGADGMYYFGSYYTQRQFNISIAYDSLTEDQIRQIKQTFGNKEPQKLIFDETPYKFYWAKCTGTPSLKFICFSDPPQNSEDMQAGRLYKGEGTLTFVCHDPFAYSVSRYTDGFKDKNGNLPKYIDDWKISSGIIEGNGNSKDYNATKIQEDDVYGNEVPTVSLNVSNKGDLETNWRITALPKLDKKITLTIKRTDTGEFLHIEDLELKEPDIKVKIDSKTNLILGATKDFNTNNTYNEYITGGSFFNLPVKDNIPLTFEIGENTHVGVIKFHYKYY